MTNNKTEYQSGEGSNPSSTGARRIEIDSLEIHSDRWFSFYVKLELLPPNNPCEIRPETLSELSQEIKNSSTKTNSCSFQELIKWRLLKKQFENESATSADRRTEYASKIIDTSIEADIRGSCRDRLQAATRLDRSNRYRRKHLAGVSS